MEVINMSEKEKQSFVDPPAPLTPTAPTPTNAEAPLFKLLGEIRDVIKENTQALNALLTTIIKQPPTVTTPTSPTVTQTTSTPIQPTGPSITPLENIQGLFPQTLQDMLYFTDEPNHIKVAPRQYLGSENFAKIASVVRDAGGEYVSAGKNSHFRIPKPKVS